MRGGRTCQMTRLPVPTPCLAVRNRFKRDYLLVWKALGTLRTRDLPESNEPPCAVLTTLRIAFGFWRVCRLFSRKNSGRSIPITWVYKGRIALPLKSRQNCVVEAAGLDKSGDETHQAGMSL